MFVLKMWPFTGRGTCQLQRATILKQKKIYIYNFYLFIFLGGGAVIQFFQEKIITHQTLSFLNHTLLTFLSYLLPRDEKNQMHLKTFVLWIVVLLSSPADETSDDSQRGCGECLENAENSCDDSVEKREECIPACFLWSPSLHL